MAKDRDGFALTQPNIYLSRMFTFLFIVGSVIAILWPQVEKAFLANPALNGLIAGVLLIGCLYTFRQVVTLRPEVRWVNVFRRADPGLTLPRAPRLLAPMASILGARKGQVTLTTISMRTILDSIGMRLDESRDISRYMIGLLIFLGLLGTFWGLLDTVTSIGSTIRSLNVGSADSAAVFEDLRAGLEAPLQGMGTAFSSSLLGLGGSLILGFLDLQAAQAQNRFYNQLEEWLSSMTSLDIQEDGSFAGTMLADTQRSIEQLRGSLAQEDSNRSATNQSLLAVADRLATLTDQMRVEQQLLHQLAQTQAELKPVLENLARNQR